MAVFLSPGVFPREIDLSVLPTSLGPLRPAFIGTATKGPMNTPVLVTSAQQYVDTFGPPSPTSYLGYGVLAFLEEGNQAYVMRVGVECADGQASGLSSVCIDTSGARGKGWGRLPLFKGIDYGRINLRAVTASNPITFHASSTGTVDYDDVSVSSTDGPTTATLGILGTYTGAIDDSFTLVITSDPDVSAGSSVGGAGFEVVRNSDGQTLASGELSDSGADGISNYIDLGNGLSIRVEVTAGVLEENDAFHFNVVPDNRSFKVAVEGDTPTEYTFTAASYTTAADFVSAFNTLVGSGEDFLATTTTLDDGTTVPQIRSRTAGERIQVTSTEAWALEVGIDLYAWDIPRSYLIGTEVGPYVITSQNSRVVIDVIGATATETVEFNVAAGSAQTADSVASSIDAAGVVAGDTLFDSFALTIPGGTEHVVVVTTSGHRFDTLNLKASYSNLKTLQFAEEVGITYPYKRSYRGFTDSRVILPDAGANDASIPLSCEADSSSATCASDTSYFANIVGWLVASSPGTWLTDYTVSLESFTDGVGDAAGRFKITLSDAAGVTLDVIEDVSFDKREARYIGNVLNPGSTLGGTNGNQYMHWDERPTYLNNDTSASDYEVRSPAQFASREFAGMADCIPTDPALSSELDAAVIGNPATSTGVYAFQNPEAIDINLLLIPGFSSGSVIAAGLQLAESRGDVLYIVDPPFGLRPQQVVDWHNGMLLSDLSASINSSYGALYWSWVKVFDQFNSDRELWVPPSGHVAAVFGRTARDAEQWSAPAGLRRGRVLTALDVEFSPSQGERNLLYGSGNAVNPLVKFPQDGITVWGQRTLQRTQSALDRVNVRMLLIYLKKNLTRLLRNFIFEPNDQATWRQAKATIDPFLADVQARRGLTAFATVIDTSNNTPERIDRNELWVSVFLKPTKTIEFIALNLVVLRTGASFSAEEVLAAGGIVDTQTAV